MVDLGAQRGLHVAQQVIVGLTGCAVDQVQVDVLEPLGAGLPGRRPGPGRPRCTRSSTFSMRRGGLHALEMRV